MRPRRAEIDVDIAHDAVADLAFDAVDARRRGIGDLRLRALEARNLQILVVVEEAGEVERPLALLVLVADLVGVVLFRLDRLQRTAADIENAGFVALRIRDVNARLLVRLVAQHNARREAVVAEIGDVDLRLRRTGERNVFAVPAGVAGKGRALGGIAERGRDPIVAEAARNRKRGVEG